MHRTSPALAAVIAALAPSPAALAATSPSKPTSDHTGPKVTITGLPAAGCTHQVRFGVTYKDPSGIAKVQIFFDGRLVGSGRGRQAIHVRLGPVRSGPHRLGAVVSDKAHNTTKVARRFRVC